MSGSDGPLERNLGDELTHPVRGRILTVIHEKSPLSAAQIAEELAMPVQKVRYQLRQLLRAELIELTSTKKRRGATERYYRTVRSPIIWDEEFAKLSDPQKLQIAKIVLSAVFADASRAVREKTVIEHHLTRVPLDADDQGWKELLEIHKRTFEEIEQVKLRVDRRLRLSGEGTKPVISALLCFVLPEGEVLE